MMIKKYQKLSSCFKNTYKNPSESVKRCPNSPRVLDILTTFDPTNTIMLML